MKNIYTFKILMEPKKEKQELVPFSKGFSL